jgi:hypothetical protein
MSDEAKVEIVLTEESHRCLVDHVSEQSSAFPPLDTATHIQGYGTTPSKVVVKCELVSAETLLALAERSCRAAVNDIKLAIKLYHSGRS